MLKGVALGFLTYGLFSMADALVKSLGGELPVMEIVFLGQAAAFAVILILRPRGERWRDMFRMRHPRRVILRAACGVTAAIFSTIAFTTIPLAEAYSLIFLAPLFVTILSIPLLGERVGLGCVWACVAGDKGVSATHSANNGAAWGLIRFIRKAGYSLGGDVPFIVES